MGPSKKAGKLALGAVVAALALVLASRIPAIARSLGTWEYPVLNLMSSQSFTDAGPETHSGTETHSGSVTFSGPTTLSGTVTQSGALNLSGTLTTTGAGGIVNTYGLTSGSGTFSGAVSVAGTLTTTGAGGIANTYGLSSGSATITGLLAVGNGTGGVSDAGTTILNRTAGRASIETRDSTDLTVAELACYSGECAVQSLTATNLGFGTGNSIQARLTTGGLLGINTTPGAGGAMLNISGLNASTTDYFQNSPSGTTADLMQVQLNSANVFELTPSGFAKPRQMTLAAIQAYTPVTADIGGQVSCTNCAVPYTIAIATGTTIQGFEKGGTGGEVK